MALQLKGRTRRNWRLPLTTGAVVLGIGLLAFKTFPHLKDSLSQYLTGEDTTEDDNEPIEVEPVDRKESEAQTPTSSSLKDTEHSDVSQWNENEMKGWLHEKSVLQRMLLVVTLLPLLSQSRRILASYNIVVSATVFEFFMKLFAAFTRILQR